MGLFLESPLRQLWIRGVTSESRVNFASLLQKLPLKTKSRSFVCKCQVPPHDVDSASQSCFLPSVKGHLDALTFL